MLRMKRVIFILVLFSIFEAQADDFEDDYEEILEENLLDDMILTDEQRSLIRNSTLDFETDYYEDSLDSAVLEFSKKWTGGIVPYIYSLKLRTVDKTLLDEIVYELNEKLKPCIFFR